MPTLVREGGQMNGSLIGGRGDPQRSVVQGDAVLARRTGGPPQPGAAGRVGGLGGCF